jgi:hypothetical protein
MEASRKRENLEELATVTVKCTGKAFQPQEQHGQRHRGMAALPVLRRECGNGWGREEDEPGPISWKPGCETPTMVC